MQNRKRGATASAIVVRPADFVSPAIRKQLLPWAAFFLSFLVLSWIVAARPAAAQEPDDPTCHLVAEAGCPLAMK